MGTNRKRVAAHDVVGHNWMVPYTIGYERREVKDWDEESATYNEKVRHYIVEFTIYDNERSVLTFTNEACSIAELATLIDRLTEAKEWLIRNITEDDKGDVLEDE